MAAICPGFKWFQIQKSGPSANQPLFDQTKFRLVRISNPHCIANQSFDSIVCVHCTISQSNWFSLSRASREAPCFVWQHYLIFFKAHSNKQKIIFQQTGKKWNSNKLQLSTKNILYKIGSKNCFRIAFSNKISYTVERRQDYYYLAINFRSDENAECRQDKFSFCRKCF